MIKSRLIDPKSGKDYHTYTGYDDAPVLVTTSHAAHDGHFAAVTLASAGTQTIVEAKSKQGIVLTDLIISGEKVNGGSITIQFTDAVNTVNIFIATVTDAPVALAIPFAGRWVGWQACDIKVVTVGNIDGSVSVGYFRTPESKTMAYAKWDAER
jgi:hypothetical protein